MKIIENIVQKFLLWAIKKPKTDLWNENKDIGTERYYVFRYDERWDKNHGLVNRLPWYIPFNLFVHRWLKSDDGAMHDHPRWSITIVLKGRLIEDTPIKRKWLTPGSVVFRSRKSIHRFEIPKLWEEKTFTLFIVGRRRYFQHYYNVDGSPKTERFIQ